MKKRLLFLLVFFTFSASLVSQSGVGYINYRSYKTNYGNGSSSTYNGVSYSGHPNSNAEFNALVDVNQPGTTLYSSGEVSPFGGAGLNGGHPGQWSVNYFAIEYTGWFKPDETGTYNIRTKADDASETMYRESSSDPWTMITSQYGCCSHVYGTATLNEDTWYEFKIRYEEWGGGDYYYFDYSLPQNASNPIYNRISTTHPFGTWTNIDPSSLNQDPTDIVLSSSSVNENVTTGTTVGGFTTTDPNNGDTHTYSLVSGSNDIDNGRFSISGANLLTNTVLDYETKSSYSIRVQTSDGSGSYEEVFTITINDVNEAPTDIDLSVTAVDENLTSGTIVGGLTSTDVDSGDTHTYTLVSGTGSTDNGSFSISTNQSLETIAYEGFDYGSNTNINNQSGGTGWSSNWSSQYYQNSYLRVISGGFTYTGLTVQGNKASWGSSNNQIVSSKRSLPTQNSGVTYIQFIADFRSSSGGGTDNVRLLMNGSLQGGIGGNGSPQTINILDSGLQNPESSGVSIGQQSLVIAQFDYDNNTTKMWVNPDLSSFDYINPTSTPNAQANYAIAFDQIETVFRNGAYIDEISVFKISSTNINNSSNLLTATELDFESKSSYNIRVQTSDGTNSYQEAFTITVNDVNEVPSDITLSASAVDENLASGTVVGEL
ncbi:cadherin domain-containing protein, partial [Flavobacteriaceae bacterium]|nr:cadherin domain-containing protein [Flavobacteriaceae bacterium]